MFENFDIDSIKWWVEDHLKEIGIIVVVIFIVIGGIKVVQISEDDGSPEGLEESLVYLIDTSRELKDTFSLLEERDIGVDPNYPVKEITLFVKEPFITASKLVYTLEKYVESVKLVEETKGKQVKAIRFLLYDRKIVWEEGLRPKGTYEYRLPTSVVTPEDVNTTTFGTETQTYDQVAWDLTLKAKGKPKYNTYKIEGSYRYLQQKTGVDLLTDQEFEWYLKYNKYESLGDGFNLYLVWELGAKPNEEGRTVVKKQFDEFVKRLSAINDQITYYDYADGVKRELIIDKPQFLYYAETSKVAKDDEEARRKLVELHPSMYTETVNAWLDKLASQKANEVEVKTEETDESLDLPDFSSMESNQEETNLEESAE